jgi:hypothetical protein
MILLIVAFLVVFLVGMAWGAGIMVMRHDRRGNYRIAPQVHKSIRSTQIGGDHYRSKTIQPWDAMEVWMPPEQFKGFLRGNAIKYLARCDDKGGMEDIKKAGHYLHKLQEHQDET